MYKVLIADDDLPVRLDLRTFINWADYGMELLEDACDGEEVMERVKSCCPDIIILDLGMPVLNGLDVLKKLKEINYQGKVLVLSCHEDFNSVSEALKIGASDYLLKHTLKRETFLASLLRIADILKKEEKEHQEKQRKDMLSQISLPLLERNFVSELISGVYKNREEALRFLDKLGVQLELKKFNIALVQVDELHVIKKKFSCDEFNSFMKSTDILYRELLKDVACLYGNIGEDEYCIILDFSDGLSYMSINAKIYEICERIRIETQKYVNLRVSVGLSRLCTDIAHAGECLLQARRALEGRFYLGRSQIIHYADVENYNCKFGDFISQHEHEIRKMIVDGSVERIEAGLGRIFGELKAKALKPAYLKVLCVELLMAVDRIAQEYNVDIAEDIPYKDVSMMDTLEDVRDLFISVCTRISTSMSRQIQGNSIQNIRSDIQKALDFIEKHYMDDIDLLTVARHVGLSRTYFSQLFKQELGVSFSDYLSGFRISRAKELLRDTDMKVYEVGAACGFPNYRYFIRIFKEISGEPPHVFKLKKSNNST